MSADIDIASIGLSASQKKDLSGGTLSEDVYVQFICSTENGYDPESDPDDRVRPSHSAFHGRVFKLRDAPVPPLDYGCRCCVRYVAAPGTAAGKMITEADSEPVTPAEATSDWLKKNVPEFETLKKSAAASTKRDALSVVATRAKKIGVAEPRSIASMIIDLMFGARNG